MSPKKRDYAVFNKFNFERKPVGVSYSLKKPEGIEQLNKNLGLCEMFKEAQTMEKLDEKIEFASVQFSKLADIEEESFIHLKENIP